MVSTRSGKSFEAPQTAGPSGGSRKRKASDLPPERQRTPPPPFADDAIPDSPSQQLFMELEVAVEAAVESMRDSPSRQLLSELNASLSLPSPPSSPHRDHSPAPSGFSSSSSSSMPPSRRRGQSPRPAGSLLESLSSRPVLPPQEIDEKKMLRWVDGRVQAHIKENGRFKTPEDYERVSKIFRDTYIARAPNEPRIDIEAVKAQKLVDEWRKSVVGTPEFIAAKKRQSRMRGEVMREGDYERQNMLNQIEATDFAYAPMAKKEMMRTEEPLLGRRERASSTSPEAGPEAGSSTAVIPTTPAAGPADSPEIVNVDVAMTDIPPVDPDVAMTDVDAAAPARAHPHDRWWAWVRRWI